MSELDAPADDWVYVVTDVEADGPRPGESSMLSFASVAVGADGTQHGRFEAVLEPLPGAHPDPGTLAWFATVPEAWEAATTDPEPADEVMRRWNDWVRRLPRPRTFAASPLAFDGAWMDHYLRRFTHDTLLPGPYEEDRLFDGPGLCLRSYTAAVTGRPVGDLATSTLPAAWLGEIEHTHRAIDDAVGYAHLLTTLLRRTSAH